MQRFLKEARRRNVHRVAIGYLAGAWLLVQVLETLMPIFRIDEAIVRWIVIALAIGFVPTLALSWAFEWSHAGLRSQEAIDADPDATQASGRTADRIIIVVLAIAVLFFAADRFLFQTEGQTGGDASIAVLPFDDMSATQDQAWFADGLAEELLNLLAKNPALKVAARTSSFSFRDSGLKVGEIAEQLDVAHILEGSVRRSGNRIRVTAQLIDARDGYHIWSESYDASFDDIFTVQDQISTQITDALEATVLGAPARSITTSPEAYELYLQARHIAIQGSPDSLATGS